MLRRDSKGVTERSEVETSRPLPKSEIPPFGRNDITIIVSTYLGAQIFEGNFSRETTYPQFP